MPTDEQIRDFFERIRLADSALRADLIPTWDFLVQQVHAALAAADEAE